MREPMRILKLSVVAVVLAAGAGPSCTTDNLPLRPSGSVYNTYNAPTGPGPGIGCDRNPPPSQC